ncbi:HAMP domain-containing histidine kinase [Paenibacillus albicereus]|uniref:histidine kinase n=1 Tax=Paenibacillus albicereus TaxID=2726185 RepID=A0A6H2GXS3_9BACL|nr:HAMP domain-containing sensor histidine kinase [Paenibacillus albicereus]QJC52205.1 HAMP domain-containing histidine kinase [Paenibacillus albicereus]
MSIRIRLLLSYIAMAAIPVVLLGIMMMTVIYLLGYDDVRDFFEENRDKTYRQSVQLGEMWYVLNHDADKLLDESYVADIDERLEAVGSGFVLTIPGSGLYVSELAEASDDPKAWFSDRKNHSVDKTVGGFSYSVYTFDFRYGDGTASEAALIFRKDDIPVIWRPVSALGMLLLVGLVSVFMTVVVSRSIVRPLSTLRDAALSLKEGNLEPVPLPRSRNELGEVGTAFEEMRQRLKDTILQMQQYEENRKMLLSHISHDLKTPITAIKGYIEGIMDGVANTPEKQEKYIRTVYAKADGMDRLIDELFLYSKLDLHKEEFHFARMDLRAFVAHYMEDQQFEMDKRGIALSMEEGESSVPVLADPEKLSRALGNMLDNSAKYMPMRDGGRSEPPSVWARLEASGGIARLTLEDNGPGIETAALPYLFDRFYRAELSRSSETGGSGLGLAIVRQIVEEHGGTIAAANRPQGGAAFIIELPLAAEREKEAEP